MRLRNLWYKSAIIYELDVRAFYDADCNGWGDFQGLIHQLDYLSALGVTAVWLKPFNTSPMRDGGYDVSDYYAVDPRLGSMGDFVDFLHEASSRGLAVISELVVDHTSIDHPWFQQALEGAESSTRDFYIWRDEPPPEEEWPTRVLFTAQEGDRSPWTFREETGQYYLHRFYEHEPDLNNAHPQVREEVLKIMGFYLNAGVAGFRIDAAPYVGRKAAESPQFETEHDYLRTLREFLIGRRPDSVLMAEADVAPHQLDGYFGAGDEMNLMLNFVLSEYLFLALAEKSARHLYEVLELLPRPPASGQYANFLRNHDELDLERLDPEDRELVCEEFAPDENMRIFGRGIRRRAAPMLAGDQRRIRLAHSLLFAMPGTPIIYYGDEIGMGEDLSLPDRAPVRTPMQWNSDTHGGFSLADPEDMYLPAIDEGSFSYRRVNVMDQLGDPDSLLNWMRRLISTRKEARPVANGSWRVLDPGVESVLALRYELEGEVFVIYHNLSEQQVEARLEGAKDLAYLYEIFADHRYGHPDPGAEVIALDSYGYRWMRGSNRTTDGREYRKMRDEDDDGGNE
jgi:maltose alpha-D-glucosyltransferase / alpha-amylase